VIGSAPKIPQTVVGLEESFTFVDDVVQVTDAVAVHSNAAEIKSDDKKIPIF
jgi:hypothetical protein